jgi:hypothetical protein
MLTFYDVRREREAAEVKRLLNLWKWSGTARLARLSLTFHIGWVDSAGEAGLSLAIGRLEC